MPLLEQVLEKYPADVKVAYKNFPIRNHKFAIPAALAALAAGEQGKFWEFHDQLFKNYNRLDDQVIHDIAIKLGLNMEEYEKTSNDSHLQKRIRQDVIDGRQAGVRGTPSIFINGIRLRDRSLKGFQTAVDKQLRKLGKTAAKPSS